MAQTIYGVALNDRRERETLSQAFEQPPYKAPPAAPVLYIKPEACRAPSPAVVEVPAGSDRLTANPTFALLFPGPPGRIGGAALALDVSEAKADYYRPAVRRQGRDGFLPLGAFQPWDPAQVLPPIAVQLNGQEVEPWRPERLVRDVEALLADIGAFMTLGDGDILLIGLQTAPLSVGAGDRVTLTADGHPPLHASFKAAAA